MFKRPAGAKPQTDTNPYLNARKEWSDRYADHIKTAQVWRLVAIGAIFVAGAAVVGLGVVSSQAKTVPYIVQVDQLGTVLPVARADQAARPDQRIIRSQLAEWVSNVRTVYADAAAAHRNIQSAYALIDQNGPAFQTVNEFMRENDPFRRAQRETVSVQVNSVLPVGGDTWRIEWTETTRGRDGQVDTARAWSAVVSTKIVTPTSEEAILVNPLGIFVNAVSWSPRV